MRSPKQSKHSHMCEPPNNSKLVTYNSDVRRRIFTTSVQAQKKRFEVSHGPNTLHVACDFYFVITCTFFGLNLNKYNRFWHLPYTKCNTVHTVITSSVLWWHLHPQPRTYYCCCTTTLVLIPSYVRVPLLWKYSNQYNSNSSAVSSPTTRWVNTRTRFSDGYF